MRNGPKSWVGENGLLPRLDPGVQERRFAVGSFMATCGTVFAVYLLQWQQEPVSSGLGPSIRALAFTGTLMAILLAHELAHYAAARFRGFRLSLPWFIPAPVLVGTFGAIIRLEGRPRDRSALLAMGAAGPIAGWCVILTVMSVRLALGGSDVPGDASPLARPLLWWVLSWLLTGTVPEPISTQDPVAFAAWIGCLLTAMNLLPFGQLDGGHVLRAVAPSASVPVGWGLTAALLLAGLLWPGWAVWAASLHLLGTRRPVDVVEPRTALDPSARAMAWMTLAVFVTCFTPVPS